ncbi:MAG TPA: type VI secretion system baseplate subunit TssG [Bryobacteraceae bacterium]|jgi:type VI secretion system protein ImpH|nr:type VI secretion system baseplate subunit TssG [Bryobacteraceae bacterium]
MATPDGRSGADLSAAETHLLRLLESSPCEVEFFQAVQLLERVYPHREPVGFFAHPSSEIARFTVNHRLIFPASEIQSIEWPDDRPPVVAVNFMGLTGPSGVLPHIYTVAVIERRWARDRAIADFLDLFHHRVISLFYRAQRKYRVAASYTEDGGVAPYLKDLTGIGTAGLEKRQDIPDQALVYYAGLLGLQPRSASALKNVIEDYFGVPAEVLQFVGAWHDLPRESQCEMIPEESPARQLGLGAVAGDQVWDHASKARIRLGPLTLERYREFLPGSAGCRALRALTRFYSGGQVDFDAQLVLARAEVPEYELGGATGLPLGLCSWAKTEEFDRDPEDAIVSLGEESWA